MISDRFPLTGDDAYLRTAGGAVELVAGTGAGPSPGVSPPVGDHRVLDVDGIDLLFTGADLAALLRRRAGPIIEVRTTKEMFPALSVDPYARRVHTVGGPEDLRRGVTERCRVMDVDGRATVVSEAGGTAVWTSPRFDFVRPPVVADLAWELAPSRLTPAGAFTYDLSMALWTGPPDGLVALPAVAVVAGADVTTARAHHLAATEAASALQITFTARVARAADLAERHAAEQGGGLLGSPLLQAVHLLERRPSSMAFHSLRELDVASREFTLYGSGDAPLTSGTARLDLRAALTGSDSVEIVVAAGVFDSFEARLNASIIDRPPVTHR